MRKILSIMWQSLMGTKADKEYHQKDNRCTRHCLGIDQVRGRGYYDLTFWGGCMLLRTGSCVSFVLLTRYGLCCLGVLLVLCALLMFIQCIYSSNCMYGFVLTWSMVTLVGFKSSCLKHECVTCFHACATSLRFCCLLWLL